MRKLHFKYITINGYSSFEIYSECYLAIQQLAKRQNISISKWGQKALQNKGRRSHAGAIYRALGNELTELLKVTSVSVSSEE